MKFHVRLLWRAQRDLDHIVTWLYQRSPRGAEAWHDAWKDTFRILQDSADRYGIAPESEGQPIEIRQIAFRTCNGRDYRALYTIQDKDVYIMHIRAPGQDLLAPDQVISPS
jgi:plasmid stabilization system protein ParE